MLYVYSKLPLLFSQRCYSDMPWDWDSFILEMTEEEREEFDAKYANPNSRFLPINGGMMFDTKEDMMEYLSANPNENEKFHNDHIFLNLDFDFSPVIADMDGYISSEISKEYILHNLVYLAYDPIRKGIYVNKITNAPRRRNTFRLNTAIDTLKSEREELSTLRAAIVAVLVLLTEYNGSEIKEKAYETISSFVSDEDKEKCIENINELLIFNNLIADMDKTLRARKVYNDTLNYTDVHKEVEV